MAVPHRSAVERTPEVVFRRSDAVPGIEVLQVSRSDRRWSVVNGGYALAVPQDWVGDLAYRGQRHIVERGMVFCTDPGEVHVTERILRKGSFRALLIDSNTFVDYMSEHDIATRGRLPQWRAIAPFISAELGQRVHAVFQAISHDEEAMHSQSKVVALMAALAAGLIADARPTVPQDPAPGLAKRIRDCLHDELGEPLDLAVLARKVGFSRYQVYRAFKQRYGLAPHAYLLALRVSRAQRLLRCGTPPAESALTCGFADQSHLGRHFKRLLGLTPAAYAHRGF